MNHYTDAAGYNAIASQPDWLFLAQEPPGDHPRGAYFTTLEPGTPNLANKLRIPRSKLAFILSFLDKEDLIPLRGGRGAYIFYSPTDYTVARERQTRHGRCEL
jgi:hypothetical protein